MNYRCSLAAWVFVCATGVLQPASAAIEITEGWTRATPPGSTVAVGYFTLKNAGKGRRELLKITSPAARAISIHQTSVDANGVSKMWPVGKLELAAGEQLRFEPTGRHIMLEGLSGGLRVGTRVPVTLVFGEEPPVTIQLEVRPLVETQTGQDAHAGLDAQHEHHH